MRPFILFAILFTILLSASAYTAITASFSAYSNTDFVADLLHSCEPIEVIPAGNMIVLRIDDIQAFSWQGTSITMINDTLKRNIPVVLGVIPKELETDKKMFNYLKENSCNIEIALHGWENNVAGNYDLAEFAELSEDEALERILKGKAVLRKITDEPIITFIPPNNLYSEGTEVALEKTGFKFISSAGDSTFDYVASTYDFEDHKLNPTSHVISECKKAFSENDLCVVMLHPQDYTTDGKLDPKKYSQYLQLLSELENTADSFVRFKDMPEFDK